MFSAKRTIRITCANNSKKRLHLLKLFPEDCIGLFYPDTVYI